MPTYSSRLAILIATFLMLPILALADDWPEWRGPKRDGISTEKGSLDGWQKGVAPKVAWRASVGKGHSAISVSRGRAFTMGWDGTQDTVYCLDSGSGKVFWKYSYPCKTIKQWPGPRSSPTVAGDRVYTLGQHGLLHAFDCESGKVVWKVQLPESYNPDVDYGFASSPLVEGEHLILNCGERGLALKSHDGSFAWGNDGKAAACASPVRCEIDGRRVVLILGNDKGENVYVVGVDPKNGKELFRSPPWPEKWGAACVDPIVRDGSFFLTTAEQHTQGARFSIRQGKINKDWSNGRLACYTGSCVVVGDAIFGISKAGLLKCLDWKTGKERWSERGFGGHGALTVADDKLVIQNSQTGEVIVIDAAGNACRELRRAKVFEKNADTFTSPVVANSRMYCRSYEGEVVCLQVGTQTK